MSLLIMYHDPDRHEIPHARPVDRPSDAAFRAMLRTLGLVERVMHPYFAVRYYRFTMGRVTRQLSGPKMKVCRGFGSRI